MGPRRSHRCRLSQITTSMGSSRNATTPNRLGASSAYPSAVERRPLSRPMQVLKRQDRAKWATGGPSAISVNNEFEGDVIDAAVKTPFQSATGIAQLNSQHGAASSTLARRRLLGRPRPG